MWSWSPFGRDSALRKMDGVVSIDANGCFLCEFAFGVREKQSKESVWYNLFSCFRLQLPPCLPRPLDHSKVKKTLSLHVLIHSLGPKSFEHNLPGESISNTGISVRMNKRREETGQMKRICSSKKTAQVGELMLGSWFCNS